MFESHLLRILITIPLTGCLHLIFLTSNKDDVKVTGLIYSLITFVMSTFLWIYFDQRTANFQFVERFEWLKSMNINLILGIDGISLFFILLTTLLVPLCLLGSWVGIKTNVKEYFIAFLAIEAILIAVFSILDLILFYVFFERVLIPIFLIIGFWGSRENKIRAAYLFFIYTLADLSGVTSCAIPSAVVAPNNTTLEADATFFLPNPVVSVIPVSVPAV